jgi:valyl-tRNA synthetase
LRGEGEARRVNTLAVLDFVLSHTLRLFHPFLPFITEELWHGMGYSQDMPENQGGKTIMFAPWPKPLEQDFRDHYGLDDCYLEYAEAKQELVVQGRNLRREYNVPSNKRVKFILKPAAGITPHDQAVLKLLLNAESLEINADFAAPKGMPRAHAKLGEIYLPLEGLIDVTAERARLTKELEKASAEVAKAQDKLNNPAFVQKVPAHVLQEHQRRLAEWQGKRDQLQKALDGLAGA